MFASTAVPLFFVSAPVIDTAVHPPNDTPLLFVTVRLPTFTALMRLPVAKRVPVGYVNSTEFPSAGFGKTAQTARQAMSIFPFIRVSFAVELRGATYAAPQLRPTEELLSIRAEH